MTKISKMPLNLKTTMSNALDVGDLTTGMHVLRKIVLLHQFKTDSHNRETQATHGTKGTNGTNTPRVTNGAKETSRTRRIGTNNEITELVP